METVRYVLCKQKCTKSKQRQFFFMILFCHLCEFRLVFIPWLHSWLLYWFFLSNNENMRRHRYYNKRTRSVFRKWKYNRCGLEQCCIRLLRYCRYYTRTHNIFTCSNKKEKNYHRLLCPTPISPKKNYDDVYTLHQYSLFLIYIYSLQDVADHVDVVGNTSHNIHDANTHTNIVCMRLRDSLGKDEESEQIKYSSKKHVTNLKKKI